MPQVQPTEGSINSRRDDQRFSVCPSICLALGVCFSSLHCFKLKATHPTGQILWADFSPERKGAPTHTQQKLWLVSVRIDRSSRQDPSPRKQTHRSAFALSRSSSNPPSDSARGYVLVHYRYHTVRRARATLFVIVNTMQVQRLAVIRYYG